MKSGPIPCGVKIPDKHYSRNDYFMKPIYSALGDAVGERPNRKFIIVCGMKWFDWLEGSTVDFADGKSYTLKEQILTCSSFTALNYDRQLGSYEVILVEDSK